MFRVRGRGSLDGEESQHSTQLSLSVSANRTTPAWKFDWSLHGDFRREQFELDERTITRTSESRSASGLVVKSVGAHWSAGLSAYQDTTIYDKLSETVARQSLVASLVQNQPWGSMNLSLLLANDPAHPRINRQEMSADVSVRITEGLSLDLPGRGSRIRDQR